MLYSIMGIYNGKTLAYIRTERFVRVAETNSYKRVLYKTLISFLVDIQQQSKGKRIFKVLLIFMQNPMQLLAII